MNVKQDFEKFSDLKSLRKREREVNMNMKKCVEEKQVIDNSTQDGQQSNLTFFYYYQMYHKRENEKYFLHLLYI